MGIIDTAKNVYDLLGKGANLELQEAVMTLRAEALELQGENLKLRERVTELESEAAQVANMVFEGGVYWSGEGEGRDGPFCQQCFDASGKVVRLQSESWDMNDDALQWYNCKTCNANYEP